MKYTKSKAEELKGFYSRTLSYSVNVFLVVYIGRNRYQQKLYTNDKHFSP